jgi:hypothetical protein
MGSGRPAGWSITTIRPFEPCVHLDRHRHARGEARGQQFLGRRGAVVVATPIKPLIDGQLVMAHARLDGCMSQGRCGWRLP